MLSVYAHLKKFEQLLEINILAVIVVESLGIIIETHAKIKCSKNCHLVFASEPSRLSEEVCKTR